MKKVSVCIATCNGERYIKKQIDSILKQLTISDEIIISDDNSNDQTLNLIKEYNDVRIKIFKNRFRDPIKNFEFALTKATGNYIFLSDQDDIWAEDKVKRMIQYLEDGFDLVLSDASIFDSQSEQNIQESFFMFNRSGPGLLNNILKNSFIGCCMVFTDSVKRMALPFPNRIPMHDSWIGIVATAFFKVKFLDETLVYYRKHDTNLSATSNGISNYHFFTKLNFRFFLIIALLRRYFRYIFN